MAARESCRGDGKDAAVPRLYAASFVDPPATVSAEG